MTPRLGPKTAVHYLQYLAIRTVLCWVQATSLERFDRYARVLATLLAHYLPIRRQLIDENLHRVFPDWTGHEVNATRQGMWHHLLMLIAEIAFSQRKIHRTNWREHFDVRGRDQIVRYSLDRRPKIFVSGHFGNFELAGFMCGLFGIPNTTMARPLDNPFLHEYVTRYRSLGGQHFLAKDNSAKEVQKLLEMGGTLAILADQDAGNKGCWVNFLGHPASCHKALALFTLSSGAPMLVVSNRRVAPLQFVSELQGCADPKIGGPHLQGIVPLTQWYNGCLENAIRKTPNQYWWLHRRWREAPARMKRQAA